MIEFVLKIGIIVATILAVILAISAIPQFAALITTASSSTSAFVSAISDFTNILAAYVQPAIGLINLVVGSAAGSALMALICWKLIKPVAMRLVEMSTGLINKIISKT